jgi:hypothetical protein
VIQCSLQAVRGAAPPMPCPGLSRSPEVLGMWGVMNDPLAAATQHQQLLGKQGQP